MRNLGVAIRVYCGGEGNCPRFDSEYPPLRHMSEVVRAVSLGFSRFVHSSRLQTDSHGQTGYREMRSVSELLSHGVCPTTLVRKAFTWLRVDVRTLFQATRGRGGQPRGDSPFYPFQ